MSEILKEHIRKFVTIDEDEFSAILKFFRVVHYKKKQNLLLEGQVCNSNYFVASGCLRMFYVNDKGVERTTQFALEHWWLADYFSFQDQKPSEFYIQAVESSEILAIDRLSQEQMLAAFPKMERYFRMVHQTAHASFQVRLKYSYDLSKEEIYKNFSSSFPGFVQRVPQYLLASYLGLTPEYLSELRGKNIS